MRYLLDTNALISILNDRSGYQRRVRGDESEAESCLKLLSPTRDVAIAEEAILHDDELEPARKLIHEFYAAEVEALIVQDRDVPYRSCFTRQAIVSSPFFWITVNRLNAGPPGFLMPRSQSETRFFETFK